MFVDYVKKYYDKSYDLNCAETIVYAANEAYNMKLSPAALKSAAGFGGGLGIEDVCGVLTGSLIVLGMLFTEKRAHESARMKTLAAEYTVRFQKSLGTMNCKQLKTDYRTDAERCSKILIDGAAILEEIIVRENNK